MEALLKPKDVAEWLNVHQSVVYKMASLNEIPSLKIGGSLRFSKAQINKWLYGKEKVDNN